MMRGLSNYFAEKIKFGLVNIEDSFLMNRFSVSTFPSLIVFETNDDLLRLPGMRINRFTGELSVKNIVNFLRPFGLTEQLSFLNEQIRNNTNFFDTYLPTIKVRSADLNERLNQLTNHKLLIYFGNDAPENALKLAQKTKF